MGKGDAKLALRKALWDLCPHDGKYGANGEMLCHEADFRRMDPQILRNHVQAALDDELTAADDPPTDVFSRVVGSGWGVSDAGIEWTSVRDPWYPGGQRDAMKWVDEFVRLFPAGTVDRGTLLGWFANAIETGVTLGARERRENKVVEVVLHRALVGPFTEWLATRGLALALMQAESDELLASYTVTPLNFPNG